MTPGLTYENVLHCMGSRMQDGTEIKQWAVGRLTLRARGKIPNEWVKEDMG